MKLSKLLVGLAVAGSIGIGAAYSAGMFPDYPVVGGATYCAGSSSSATGSIIGAVTGCPNQVPAGPTIVTGNEQIPADTRLSSGANPQTVLVPMASLNALPITVQSVNLNVAGATAVSAANNSGGLVYLVTGGASLGITQANITLPANPIDGQQYAISSNRTLTVLTVTAGGTNTIAANTNPTVMTASLTVPQGYRFIFNLASTSWLRIQ